METNNMFCFLVIHPDGLNRTMQYGNGMWQENSRGEIIGLNHTMQYGNKVFRVRNGSTYSV